jgi:hypothetical protein
MADLSLYQALRAIGADIDHHESDLWVRATQHVITLLKDYPTLVRQARPFVSTLLNERGEVWLDIPFQYEPFWDLPGEPGSGASVNTRFYSGPAYEVVIQPNGRGYWEHVVFGDEDSGSLTFDGMTLVDYDGAYELPQLVTDALRREGYKVDEDFDTDWVVRDG